MSGLSIACPKCQAPLKLKDRSLLGKTGKCPRCAHKFVLQEPAAEVPLELVEPVPPPEGKNAQWIPDTPPAAPPITPVTPAAPVIPVAAAPVNPLADLFGETPSAKPADDPLAFLSGETTVLPDPVASPVNPLGLGETIVSPSVSPVTSRRKKKRRSSGGKLALFLVLIAAGLGGGLYYRSTLSDSSTTGTTAGTVGGTASKSTPAPTSPAASETSGKTANAPARTVAAYNPFAAQSPTAGKPIQLLNMPAGVRLVVHLRPAQLWSQERQYAEFRASLGPLATWLENQITELTKQQPAAIEELLLGFILGPRGTMPELAAVVHLKEPQQRADLLRTYTGQTLNEFSTDIRINNEQAYRIVNEKTIAICPALYAEDLSTFEKTPAMTADHIQEMLRTTDRDRLVTVVFDPDDIDQHLSSLFPASMEELAGKTLRWLGEDAWVASWSMHVEEDFYTELAVRGTNDVGPAKLSQLYRERLDVMPELLLLAVEKMNPQHTGYRQLIGRFPAMMKVLSLASQVGVDGRLVRMGALLPPKAAPNLALGALLSWDESTRTDFSAAIPVATTVMPQATGQTFQQRLQTKMDAEFRNTPLQEVFDFIADGAKIPIEIDGDALKLAGFTKNMPQTFARPQATTLEAIYGVIKTYESEPIPMVIHLDEAGNQILVLTQTVATERGLKIFDFKKEGIK